MEPHAQGDGVGRREAHKRATRQALQDAAQRLFAENGYTQTTVQEIAAAAGVTERTFFRYFTSKDELVAHRVLGNLPALRAAVIARPQGESPLGAIHAVMRETIAAGAADPNEPSTLRLFDSGPPGVRLARTGANLLLRIEETLAEAVHERLQHATPDSTSVHGSEIDLHCEVVAAAAVAAARRALIRYSSQGPGATVGVEQLIDEAFETLDGSPSQARSGPFSDARTPARASPGRRRSPPAGRG